MKKLLLLMTALLIGVSGAWGTSPNILALPQPGKIYYMSGYNATQKKKAYLYADGTTLKGNPSYTKAGDFAYLWLCAKTSTGYTFQNLSTGKYIEGPFATSNNTKAQLSDNATAYVFTQDVQNTQCVSLVANSQYLVVSLNTNKGVDRLTSSNNYYSSEWCSDILFEEYAAQTLSHNQHYYIYCDNDDSSDSGTDRPQYIYNNEGSFDVQLDKSQVSLTNYAWRSQKNSENHFSFKNGTKYLSFHQLDDAAYDWQSNKMAANNTGRVTLYGKHPTDSRSLYMLIKYDGSYSGGVSEGGSRYSKSGGAWSEDYMFVVAPQTNVYRVAIKVEGGSEANAVFTCDGVDYSGDCSIYVDGNNLPATASISLKSYDDSNYLFQGFELEDGTSLGKTVDVSALTADKGVKAVFVQLPFTLSDSYATATWYYLKVGPRWISMNRSSKVSEINDSQIKDDNAIWAFIKESNGKISIVNSAAGSGYYLDFLETAEVSNNPAYYLCDIEVDGATVYFKQDGYYVQITGTGLSVNSPKDATWCPITTEAVDWKELSYSFIDDYADAHAKGKYFGVAQTIIDTNKSKVEDAETYGRANYYQLTTFADAILTITYPENGYYRIKSSGKRDIGTSYIGYGTASNGNVGLITISEANAAKDVSTIIKFTKNPSSNRQYAFSTQGLNVQSQTYKDSPFPATNASGVYFAFTVQDASTGAVSIKNAASENTSSDENVQGCLHEAAWNVPGVVNWNSSAPASQWTIEDATSVNITLNNGGDGYYYGTAYCAFPVSTTEDCLYILTGTGEDKLTLTKVNEVPEGQGFLIRCAAEESDNNATTKTITLTIPASATLSETNLFSGHYLAGAEDGTIYVLSNNGGVGFFPLQSGVSIPANRAYITESTVGNVRGLVLNFEDEETGVASVVSAQHANSIFDLQGRRVTKALKGIYIQNGKKVLY